MDLGGYTATGPRDANEDNYYIVDFSEVRSFTNGITSFVMVSDGMGGYQGGDVASGLAVSSAESYISQLLDMADGNQVDLDAAVALSEISQNAHEAILAETRERGNASMGATFVGAFLSPTHAWIGHVGDSRAYLVRNGEAMQLTEDHSQVGRMLSRGLITEEEAQNHPARNRIERALGFSDAEPEMNEVDLEPSDALLLCSDGVYTVLNCQALGDCVAGARDAESAASRIVKQALNKNTDDNSTAAVAMNVESAHASLGRRKSRPTIRTSAVSQPRHAGADRVHMREQVEASRQEPSGARKSAGSGAARAGKARSSFQMPESKSSRKLVVPIAVAVVLVIVLVVVFVFAQGGQGARADTQNPPVVSPTSSSQPSAGVEGSLDGGVSSSAATAPSTVSSMKTFEVQSFEGATPVLKYIDGSDNAHRFDEELLPSFEYRPRIRIGSTVEAETTSQAYKVSGGSYRALAGSYRVALLNDIQQFRAAGRTADSLSPNVVSNLFDPDEYEQFLELLAQLDDQQLGTISKLAIDAACTPQ